MTELCSIYEIVNSRITSAHFFFHSEITSLNRGGEFGCSVMDLNGLHLISVASIYLIKSNQNSI